MENDQSIIAKVFCTNAHQQEVFKFGEHLRPRILVYSQVDGVIGIFATTEHEDLHVLFAQRVVAPCDEQIDETVEHLQLIEVGDV